ncbi:hypothetical protein V8B97DRAFT_2003585 [Scleroderma yunnanense]
MYRDNSLVHGGEYLPRVCRVQNRGHYHVALPLDVKLVLVITFVYELALEALVSPLQAIFSRYYDLVRIYHPDSIIARRLPPEVSQERIQAINKAYDTLRGRNVPLDEAVSPTPGRRMDTAWLKARSSRRPYFDDVVGDERWIERTIVVFAVFVIDVSGFRNYKLTIVPQTLVAFIAQTSFTRLQVLKSSTAQQAGSSGRKHVQSDDILAEPSVLNEKS